MFERCKNERKHLFVEAIPATEIPRPLFFLGYFTTNLHSFSQLEANSRLTRQPVLPVRNLNKCFFQYCTYLQPVKPSWASTIGEEAEEEEAEAGAEIEAATEEEVEDDTDGKG